MTTSPNWGGRRAQRAVAWVLHRDFYVCWICGHEGADTLDHIKSRKTHPELTWEPTNWKAAHGEARPQFDCPGQYSRGTYAGPRRPGTSVAGLLRVVIGPPAAGKTTHIAQHRRPDDIVIDHDALARALGAPADHVANGPHAALARKLRTVAIQDLLDHPRPAWIIHTTPTPADTTRYDNAGATPVLIDPGKVTTLRRAREQREHWTLPAIHTWYEQDAERLHTWAATTAPATTTDNDW